MCQETGSKPRIYCEQVKAVEPAAPTDVEHYAGKSTADRAAEIMASDLSDEEVLAQLEREGIDIDNLTADEDNISSEIKVDLDAIAPPGSRSGINQTVNYILLGIAIAGALIFGTLFVVRFINRQALTDEAKAAEKAEYEAMEKKQNEKKAQQTSHANDPQNIEKRDAE